MSVGWTETAAGQLLAARDYLARSSPGYAQALAARVVARTDRLAAQPLLGSEVPEYDDPEIREVFEHPYPILYRIGSPGIVIIAVIHSSGPLPRNPPG